MKEAGKALILMLVLSGSVSFSIYMGYVADQQRMAFREEKVEQSENGVVSAEVSREDRSDVEIVVPVEASLVETKGVEIGCDKEGTPRKGKKKKKEKKNNGAKVGFKREKVKKKSEKKGSSANAKKFETKRTTKVENKTVKRKPSVKKQKDYEVSTKVEDSGEYTKEQIQKLRERVLALVTEQYRGTVKYSVDLQNAATRCAIGEGNSAMQILAKYGGKGWKRYVWQEKQGQVWVQKEETLKEIAEKLVSSVTISRWGGKRAEVGIGFDISRDGDMVHIKAVVILVCKNR